MGRITTLAGIIRSRNRRLPGPRTYHMIGYALRVSSGLSFAPKGSTVGIQATIGVMIILMKTWTIGGM
jgi:hypothetical protein